MSIFKNSQDTEDLLPNIHPGVILKDFLEDYSLSSYKLSSQTKIPQSRICLILQGKRAITTDTAIRLSRFFGNSVKFWLGLQTDYDLEEQLRNPNPEIESIKRIESSSLG